MNKFQQIDIAKAMSKICTLSGCEGCPPKQIYEKLKHMGFPAQEILDHLLTKKLIRFDASSETYRPTPKGWKSI